MEITNSLPDKTEEIQWRTGRPYTQILQLARTDVRGVGSLDHKGIIAQGFLCSMSLFQMHPAWAALCEVLYKYLFKKNF